MITLRMSQMLLMTSDDKCHSVYFASVQGSGFNVQSATSPRSLNLPYSDTWSSTLNLRSDYI